jgi:hypothetical protein
MDLKKLASGNFVDWAKARRCLTASPVPYRDRD